MRAHAIVVAVAAGCAASPPAPKPPPVVPPTRPAPTEPRVIAPSPPAPIVGDIGTAAPTLVVASGDRGQWVAFCQAREDTNGDGVVGVEPGHHGDFRGDELREFLAREAGPGRLLSRFVDADPTRRYLAVVWPGASTGEVALIDSWRDEETVLSHVAISDPGNPDLSDGRVSLGGGRVAWATTDGARAVVHVRDLDDGSELELDGGPSLWRFSLDVWGNWLWMWRVDVDTDGDGVLTRPTRGTSLASSRCRGPALSASFSAWRGDRPVTVAIPLRHGGNPLVDLEPLAVLDGTLVARGTDGSIVLHDGITATPVVAASCAGRVVEQQRSHQALEIGCTAGGSPLRDGFVEGSLLRIRDGRATPVGTGIIAPFDDFEGDPLGRSATSPKSAGELRLVFATRPEGFPTPLPMGPMHWTAD